MTTDSNDLVKRIRDLNSTIHDETVEQEVQARIDTFMPIWNFIQAECLNDIIWKAVKDDRADILEALRDNDMFTVDPYETREIKTDDNTEELNILGAAIGCKSDTVISFLHTQNTDFVDRLYGKQEDASWDIDNGVPIILSSDEHSRMIAYYADKNLGKSEFSYLLFKAIDRGNKDVVKTLIKKNTSFDITTLKRATIVWFKSELRIPTFNALQQAIQNRDWKMTAFFLDMDIFKMTEIVNKRNHKKQRTVQSLINNLYKNTLSAYPEAQILKDRINAEAARELKTASPKKKRFLRLG